MRLRIWRSGKTCPTCWRLCAIHATVRLVSEIVRAVIRFRPEGLRELLLELLQDPNDGLALEAARGLARLKVREAREAILARFAERMAKRGQGEFRKMVEKVVARLER